MELRQKSTHRRLGHLGSSICRLGRLRGVPSVSKPERQPVETSSRIVWVDACDSCSRGYEAGTAFGGAACSVHPTDSVWVPWHVKKVDAKLDQSGFASVKAGSHQPNCVRTLRYRKVGAVRCKVMSGLAASYGPRPSRAPLYRTCPRLQAPTGAGVQPAEREVHRNRGGNHARRPDRRTARGSSRPGRTSWQKLYAKESEGAVERSAGGIDPIGWQVCPHRAN